MPFELSLHIWKSAFSFLFPIPLDECAVRLQKRNEPSRIFSFKSPLKVEVDTIDPDAFQFRMYRDTGRNLIVEAVGVLERSGDHTLVSGESRFSRMTVLLILGLSIVLFPMFGIIFVVFGGFFYPICAISMINGCHALESEISTLLEKPVLVESKTATLVQSSQHSYVPTKKKRNLEIIAIVIIAIILLSFSNAFNGFGRTEHDLCAVGEAAPRPVLKSSLDLKPIWSLHAPLGTGYDKPRLVIVGDTLYAQNCRNIMALDLQSGKTKWVSENTGEFGDGFDGQMTVDVAHNRIYGRKSIWGVRAISVSTGKILWTNDEKLFERAMPYLDLLDTGKLLAQNERGAWYIDPQTDDAQPTTQLTHYGNLPQQVSGLELSLCDSCLKATDAAMGKLIWRFTGDNGADLVSNAAVENNIVYVMDQHAKIYLLDLHSGNRLGELQFELPLNQDNLHNGDGQISDSVIAVQGNLMAVSFHDTDVLAVYRFSRP